MFRSEGPDEGENPNTGDEHNKPDRRPPLHEHGSIIRSLHLHARSGVPERHRVPSAGGAMRVTRSLLVTREEIVLA